MKMFSGIKEEIKNIKVPDKVTRTKTSLLVISFAIFFTAYLFGCDAFISYLFKILNI